MTAQTSILLTATLFILAMIAVYKGIPVLISAAKSKMLLDKPNDNRKVHENPTPALGGVAIFASLWIFYSIHPLSTLFAGYSYMLAGSILLFLVGIKDDLYMMSASKKLVAQILAATFMVWGGGLSIETFGGIFGIDTIPPVAGSVMAIFVMVVVINSMNLIDGVDGLAGSLTVISALFFSGWFAAAGYYGEAVFSLILAGAFAGFLFHNWQPANIFMGDAGALLSGFYLSILGIRFLTTAVNDPVIIGWQTAAPVILVSVLIVPLYDTLRVFMIRVFKGQSPFSADADHVHHHLIKMGFSHQNVTLVLSALQIGFIALSIGLAPYFGVNALLAIVLASALLVFPTLSFKRKLLSKTLIPGYIEKNGGARAQEISRSMSVNRSSNIRSPRPEREANEGRPGMPERVCEPDLEEEVKV